MSPFDRLTDTFAGIALDSTSGSTEIMIRLLRVCAGFVEAGDARAIAEGLAFLEDYHPSMISFHALRLRLLAELFSADGTVAGAVAAAQLASLIEEFQSGHEVIARQFAAFLTRPARILTLTRSSTVLSALRHCHRAGLVAHLHVLESRPMDEGVLTARECAGWGIACSLSVDAAMAELMQDADFALVGADGITRDGFLLNKTGTCALAMCCAELGKPLYVLADSSKFTPVNHTDIPILQHSLLEVLDKPRADDAFTVRNLYFDWTPVRYVTRLFTGDSVRDTSLAIGKWPDSGTNSPPATGAAAEPP